MTSDPTCAAGPPPPRIVLSAADLDQLRAIAFDALLTAPRLAGALLDEVRRAVPPESGAQALRHAGLGSCVAFRDDETRRRVEVRLVAARPEAPSRDLPVLSPLGIALLGLRAGQSAWVSDRRGPDWRLTILEVGGRAAS